MKPNDNIAKQGIIMLAASTISNSSNFFFQLIIGRMLGPAEYSVLTALLALLMIVSVPTSTIQTVIAKYTATFRSQNSDAKISYLLFRSIKKISVVAIITFFLFSFGSFYIASFFKINSIAPVIILGAVVSFSLITPIGRGILQGIQDFRNLGTNLIIDTLLRLICGVVLVAIGLKASGAIAASAISGIIAFSLFFVPLRKIFHHKQKPVDFNSSEIYKYFWPVFITLLCFTVLTNIDIIIVKHLFSSKEAGYYSAAAILGKACLFFPMALSTVIFPKTAQLNAKNDKSIHLLNKSLLYVGIMCVAAITIFMLAPKFVILIVFGNSFLPSSSLLGLFGVAMSMFSLVNMLIFYNLSINNLKFIPSLIAFTLLQIVALWFLPTNLAQVLYVLVITATLLFLAYKLQTNKFSREAVIERI